MKRITVLEFVGSVVLCAVSVHAQQNEAYKTGVLPQAPAVASYTDSSLVPPPTISSEPLPAAPDQGGAQPSAFPSEWHSSVTPYLWLAGVHGSVGALGRDASVHASPGDVLSHFRFGLAGTFDIRRERFVAPIDLMWLRLEDDKAIPYPPALSATSVNAKAGVLLFTPKVGVRVIDTKMFKADALAGIRLWHFSEKLEFSPSQLGLNISPSQNWVDPVVGGRIEANLSPQVTTTIAGDVGGWGTGSQLEYQALGLLGFKIKPTVTLQAGYRYLYVDHVKGGAVGAFQRVALDGAIIGVTFKLK